MERTRRRPRMYAKKTQGRLTFPISPPPNVTPPPAPPVLPIPSQNMLPPPPSRYLDGDDVPFQNRGRSLVINDDGELVCSDSELYYLIQRLIDECANNLEVTKEFRVAVGALRTTDESRRYEQGLANKWRDRYENLRCSVSSYLNDISSCLPNLARDAGILDIDDPYTYTD